MIGLKKTTSVLLSAVLLFGIAGNMSAIPTNAASVNYPVKLSTVLADWNNKMAKEQKKYEHGKYWNDINNPNGKEGYTETACNHDKTISDCFAYHVLKPFDDKFPRVPNQTTTEKYKQCMAFARKLANDVFRTDHFIRYNIVNGKINYTTGGWKDYVPQVGDQLRLLTEGSGGHSVFITGIDNGKITFAGCNGDMKTCKIEWGCTQYYTSITNKKLIGVDMDYIKNNAIYVERVILAGDLNLNGKIDKDDLPKFKSVMIDYKHPDWKIYATDYDVNGDLKINSADYTALSNYASKSQADGYIVDSFSAPQMPYNSPPTDCFVYKNGIYKRLKYSGAAFIGSFLTETTNFNVADYPIDPSDRQTYSVVEIGKNNYRYGIGDSMLNKLESITIPQTTKIINLASFASNDISALKNVYFSGTPALKAIGSNAFMNCKNLSRLDLSSCRHLTEIGNCAFYGCTKLSLIMLPSVSSQQEQP